MGYAIQKWEQLVPVKGCGSQGLYHANPQIGQAARGKSHDAKLWDVVHNGAVPQWCLISLVFSFFYCVKYIWFPFPQFLSKFVKSPKIFPQILESSRCNQKWLHCCSQGTSPTAGTRPCFVQPLLLSYGSLASCYGVASAQRSLGIRATNLQFKPSLCMSREENEPTKLFVCAVVQLLEDQNSW